MLSGRKVENEMILGIHLGFDENKLRTQCSLGAGFEVRARVAGRMVATLQFSVFSGTFFCSCVADGFDGVHPVHPRCCLGKNVTFMNNLYPGPLAALIALIFHGFSYRLVTS